jgi:threonine/homoserine/homoserine lactone efflux protein
MVPGPTRGASPGSDDSSCALVGESRPVSGTDTELVLVTLAAMLSPTTLSFCVLTLVLGERPLRAGAWFYIGAFTATMAVGVLAAFVLGDAAADRNSTPRTWVAIVDIVAGAFLLAYVVRVLRRPRDEEREAEMVARVGKLASAPALAIVAAGATLANPGMFIPLALKEISQLDPSAAEYILLWLVFAVVSLLPLAAALLMLVVAPAPTERVLGRARGWLERHARTVAGVLVIAVAAALIRNGITGLT